MAQIQVGGTDESADNDHVEHPPMSTNDSRSEADRVDEQPAERGDSERYDELEIGNGDVVIYDTENHHAWIQSDDAVTRESMA